MNRWVRLSGALMSILITLTACLGNVETPGASATPVNRLTYDAPVSLTIKTGATLPGTTLGYSGKSETGAAKVTIASQLAIKQVADTVDWQGAPVSNVNLKLTTRVASFDDQALTLVGTAHIEIINIKVTPGGSPGTAMLEFSSPVTFSLKKNDLIPGSILAYAGATPDGAQFLGVEGYPYRKQFDSLQYVGRVAPQVFLKLDLRVLSYTETGAVVGGTATIRIEQ
jgi:hypothetical protein